MPSYYRSCEQILCESLIILCQYKLCSSFKIIRHNVFFFISIIYDFVFNSCLYVTYSIFISDILVPLVPLPLPSPLLSP